jgi:deoxyadenosine/deoxycytidine kinase
VQERQSAGIKQPVRLMERSVFSDRMVFVRAVNESKWMSDVELAVYDSMFTSHLNLHPSLVPDGFIYLRCTPDTCMNRYAASARWVCWCCEVMSLCQQLRWQHTRCTQAF